MPPSKYNNFLFYFFRRAQLKGFHQVLLYDPAGEIQLRKEELEDSLKWVDFSRKIQIWSGWQRENSSNSDSSSGEENKENTGAMEVALLSAADAEEPLLKAAAAPSTQAADPLLRNESNLEPRQEEGSGLEAAIAAPLDIKTRLVAAAGPVAGIEPDIVVVFGSAFTLAGFPPWAVRTSELFEVGALAAVTSGKMDAVLRRYLGTRQRFGK